MKKGIIVLVSVTMLAVAAGAVYFYQLQERTANGQKVTDQNTLNADSQSSNDSGDNESRSANSMENDSSTKTAGDSSADDSETDSTQSISSDNEGAAQNESADTDGSIQEASKDSEPETTDTKEAYEENSDITQSEAFAANASNGVTLDPAYTEEAAAGSDNTAGNNTDSMLLQENSNAFAGSDYSGTDTRVSDDPGAYVSEDTMQENELYASRNNEAFAADEEADQEDITDESVPGDNIFAQADSEDFATLNQDLLSEEDESSTADDAQNEEDSDILAYAPTTGMSFEELIGDNGNYDFPEGYPDSDTYCLIVDEFYQVVLVYAKDDNGEFTVPVRYMLCSTGRDGGTAKGTFTMGTHRVRFGRFVNTGYYAQYWTQLSGRIYFHSVLYTDRDPAAYVESAYSALGTQASAGCIRLTVPDARWIFYNVAHDSSVIVRYGSASDEETAKIREQLILAELPAERVIPVAGQSPDTDNWSIDDVLIEVPFQQGVAAIYQ